MCGAAAAPSVVLSAPDFEITVTTIITLPSPDMTTEEFYESQKKWANLERFISLKKEFLEKGYMSKDETSSVKDGKYTLTRKFKSKVFFDLWIEEMRKVIDTRKLAQMKMKVYHKIK